MGCSSTWGISEIKGSTEHEAFATAGSREGQMYAALPLYAEGLFPYFETITPRSQCSNATIAPRLTFTGYLVRKQMENVLFFPLFLIWRIYTMSKTNFLLSVSYGG